MAVELHAKGAEFARGLIQQARFDLVGDWASNQPTPQDGDAYIAEHGFEKYGNWFLGVNMDADPNTKERYEFPIGNFKEIFRSGVIAAEQRAGQYGHEKIKKAAHELLEMMPK